MARDSVPRPVAPWIERVPRLPAVSAASATLVVTSLLFAFLAAQRTGWDAWAGPLVAVVALPTVLLSPVRLGPWLALASVGVLVAVDTLAGAGGSGFAGAEVGLAFLLLTSLLAASYVRLGLRRRESELVIAQEALGELAQRDRITGLLSGRRQLTWLEAELARARRHHHEVALVFIRPDGLDALGDDDEARLELLEATAEVIGNELRATDVALRFDAETFALILAETPTEGARVAAERVRLLLPQRLAGAGGVTVSSGIATFPRDASTNEELTQIAEYALERAVALGGNRTVCASVDPDVPRGWALAGAER